MKAALFVLISIAPVLCAGYAWFVWTRHQLLEKEAKRQAQLAQNYRRYEALIPIWRQLHPGIDECGGLLPGLVQFAAVGISGNESFRVATGMNGRSGLTLSDAANELKAQPADLAKLVAGMKVSSFTAIYQHDSELHFIQDDEPPIGFMFVPENCPQAQNYLAWNKENDHQFAYLKLIAPGWYYYQAQR